MHKFYLPYSLVDDEVFFSCIISSHYCTLVTDHLSLKHLQAASHTLFITHGKDNCIFTVCSPNELFNFFFFCFLSGIDQMEQWQEEKNKQCIVTGFKTLFGE